MIEHTCTYYCKECGEGIEDRFDRLQATIERYRTALAWIDGPDCYKLSIAKERAREELERLADAGTEQPVQLLCHACGRYNCDCSVVSAEAEHCIHGCDSIYNCRTCAPKEPLLKPATRAYASIEPPGRRSILSTMKERPTRSPHACECWRHECQVCDICQGTGGSDVKTVGKL